MILFEECENLYGIIIIEDADKLYQIYLRRAPSGHRQARGEHLEQGEAVGRVDRRAPFLGRHQAGQGVRQANEEGRADL